MSFFFSFLFLDNEDNSPICLAQNGLETGTCPEDTHPTDRVVLCAAAVCDTCRRHDFRDLGWDMIQS